jgi:hypothetical protein
LIGPNFLIDPQVKSTNDVSQASQSGRPIVAQNKIADISCKDRCEIEDGSATSTMTKAQGTTTERKYITQFGLDS